MKSSLIPTGISDARLRLILPAILAVGLAIGMRAANGHSAKTTAQSPFLPQSPQAAPIHNRQPRRNPAFSANGARRFSQERSRLRSCRTVNTTRRE